MPRPNLEAVSTAETGDILNFWNTGDVLHEAEQEITLNNFATVMRTLGGLYDSRMVSGAIAQTALRRTSFVNQSPLTSGQLYLVAIDLRAGDVITNISFLSGTQAAGTPTHQLFGLYSSARAKLASSADATSAAWAANTVKTLAMTTAYTVTTTGLHYVGVMVAATTPPDLIGVAVNAVQSAIPPIMCGTSDGSLTTSLPATATAITATTSFPFAYVS